MHDTDSRLAKFSGRGLIVNVFTYFLCLSIGDLTSIAPTTAVTLTTGLIITALIRGFLLVRFEQLYATGPSRWRSFFFIATLAGASWWSVILVISTLTLGMTGETPLLWFYTIIFFATTIHATSPYRVFSQVYLLTTLLPPVVAAFYVGGVIGYMYSLMMLIFLGLLLHLVNSLCHGYWGRLEANYALRQKTISLEVEKRDIDASVDLNSQFLVNLGHEFRTSLNDILGGLSLLTDSNLDNHQHELLQLAQKAGERQLDLVNNIVDFSRITNRTLVLDHSVFNLRSLLELWITDLAVNAHQQGVEIDYDMHAAVPLRVHGDAKRIGQIFKNLLNNAVQFSEQGNVFIDIDFKRESEKGGHLEITIVDRANGHQANGQKAIAPRESTPNEGEGGNRTRTKGLWFTICKGLSECMNGSIDIDSPPGKETQYHLRLPLAAAQQSTTLNSQPKLRDKKVLIIDPELPIGRFHLDEMLEWGLILNHASDYESAYQQLLDAQSKSTPYSMVLINLFQNIDAALSFSQRLLEHFHEAAIPQLYLLSYNHLNERSVRLLVDENESVSFHYRPISPQSFHDLVAFSLLGKPIADEQVAEQEHLGAQDFSVLVVDDHRVNQMVAQGMLKKLGYHVRLAGNGLEALQEFQNRKTDLILMDCQMPEMDGFETTRRIRQLESDSNNNVRTPIIAMTAHVGDEDQSQCFACGMDDYIAKPVKYDVLQGHLLRWLGGNTSRETKEQLI